MMMTAAKEMPLHRSSSSAAEACHQCNSIMALDVSNLIGVKWRVYLGILPSSPNSSIDDFRRVAADSRRKYASLRRRFLVDPHLSMIGSKSPEIVMDNPLSQNPDSMWGRFFRNAEIEKMLDKDLSRLYPEHGYFQTSTCQSMLRRILLLWCLRHPEYGYRQGMHELLAPLLYVLHIDIQRLSEVREAYEDHFTDEFDGKAFSQSDVLSNYRFTRKTGMHGATNNFEGMPNKIGVQDDLDSETRNIILLSDAYGAEGELGIVVSERYMEHDAYCLFDALMKGSHGVVAMAEFFSSAPINGSSTYVLPVIEASSAVYHLLSIADSSLHSHLAQLGVEPQYFCLRWLRILFGREFLLDDLLVIWDEIFSSSNGNSYLNSDSDVHPNFNVLSSPRGAFITAMALAMILHLRSSLLATENATSCLQKLLNFPKTKDVKKLITKARTLQTLVPSPLVGVAAGNKPSAVSSHRLSFGSASNTPVCSVTESYWEKKWRVAHRTEELNSGTKNSPLSHNTMGGPLMQRLKLSRMESSPPSKAMTKRKDSPSSVRRRLMDDLPHEVESATVHHKEQVLDAALDSSVDVIPAMKLEEVEKYDRDFNRCSSIDTNFSTSRTCLSVENRSEISSHTSPKTLVIHQDSDTDKSSVNSNSCAGDDEGARSSDVSSHDRESVASVVNHESDVVDEKHEMSSKEEVAKVKIAPSLFQWFWKFGRTKGEENLKKGGNLDPQKSETPGSVGNGTSNSTSSGCVGGKVIDVGDKKVLGTLKNLGQFMLENIQVIESAFQQERGQSGSLESISANILGGKGQATAMAALKELRKISNLLSEM